MKPIHLFTDASVNNQLKIGFGAYLAVENLSNASDDLLKSVQLRRFDNTSSTKLELQTLLWAIQELMSAERSRSLALTI